MEKFLRDLTNQREIRALLYTMNISQICQTERDEGYFLWRSRPAFCCIAVFCFSNVATASLPPSFYDNGRCEWGRTRLPLKQGYL